MSTVAMPEATVGVAITLRCYAELNDFLPPERRFHAFPVPLLGEIAVAQLLREQGVPTCEVDLVLVDGESVPLDQCIRGGERIAAYPVFERFDLADTQKLRPRPLRRPRFFCDVHLARLARHLRAAGFDCRWEASIDDGELRREALREHRIILTRDRGLLLHPAVTHARFVRSEQPGEQLAEIVRALQLEDLARPFSRCLLCNQLLERAQEEQVAALPRDLRERHRNFLRCPECDRVYWPGSHFRRLSGLLRACGFRTGAGDAG